MVVHKLITGIQNVDIPMLISPCMKLIAIRNNIQLTFKNEHVMVNNANENVYNIVKTKGIKIQI